MGLIPENITRLFWDVDEESVDIKLHQSYIIKRIMDYGTIEDVRWMFKAYSAEEIIEAVKKSRGLSRKSAYFWAGFFIIPKDKIECLKIPFPKEVRLVW